MSSACTTVVTEYRQMELGQAQRIKIEVEYLSEMASKEHIKELLWSFRRRILLPDVSEGQLGATDHTEDEESEQAWLTLSAAFGNEEGFNHNFLCDQSDGAFERITDQLVRWSKNIPWPLGSTDGKWITYAETADECFEHLRPFVRDRLWPFTRIIR